MNPEFIMQTGLIVFLLGGLLIGIREGDQKKTLGIGLSCAGVGSLLFVVLGLSVIFQGNEVGLALGWLVPWVKGKLFVDGFSALFVVLINLVGLMTTIFAWGYMAPYGLKKNLGAFVGLYNIFLLSMTLVVMADNVIHFLFFWELMSLVSFFLVIFEHEKKAVRKAGFTYVIMTHLGTAFLILAFFLLSQYAGSVYFRDFSGLNTGLPPVMASFIFLSLLVGFGTKAGLVPLHIWLPQAHPAAPAPISALMSGVMVKTAVYGFVRLVFGAMLPGAYWWGLVILGLGLLAAFFGASYGLMQADAKRLLAYSTIENLGLIFVGVGLSILTGSLGLMEIAQLSMAAALLHLINHGIFKSLLFLGAGSVIYSTHCQDMDQLGGLLKRMPLTGLLFLIGIMALAALPPLNGFTGEWLLLQSLLSGATHLSNQALAAFNGLGFALVGFVGALTAFAGVKLFGSLFLALPRSKKAELAEEVPLPMHIAMGFLALLCLLLGVFPNLVLSKISVLTANLWQTQNLLGTVHQPAQLLAVPGNQLSIALLALVFFLGLGLVTAALWFNKARLSQGNTWTCGIEPDSSMEYSGTAFVEPVRIILSSIYSPGREVKKEYDIAPYFSTSITYNQTIKPLIEQYLYQPTVSLARRLSENIKKMQTGSIHTYLLYTLVTLIILLMVGR